MRAKLHYNHVENYSNTELVKEDNQFCTCATSTNFLCFSSRTFVSWASSPNLVCVLRRASSSSLSHSTAWMKISHSQPGVITFYLEQQNTILIKRKITIMWLINPFVITIRAYFIQCQTIWVNDPSSSSKSLKSKDKTY